MTVTLIDASADKEQCGTASKALRRDYSCKFKGSFILYIYFNLNPYLYDFLRTMECQVFIDVNCFDIENTNNTQNKVSTAGKRRIEIIVCHKKSFSYISFGFDT